MKDLLTPRQVANAIGVSEASLKRWCDRGKLPSVRTAGGHRRIPVSGVIEFLRRIGQPPVRPEVLGLPSTTGQGTFTLERARLLLVPALLAGDDQQVERVILDLYLAGHAVPDICDQVIAPAFHELGSRWQHGDVEVYAERRGCEICRRAFYQLRRVMPAASESAPRAIGATFEGDPYTIPTLMAELTLREAGWQAESYGVGHPVATLCAAVREVRPRLLWLSVSAIGSTEAFLAQYPRLYEIASECRVPIIVGGRALTEEIRRAIPYSAYGDTMRHLLAFARTLQEGPGHSR